MKIFLFIKNLINKINKIFEKLKKKNIFIILINSSLLSRN